MKKIYSIFLLSILLVACSDNSRNNSIHINKAPTDQNSIKNYDYEGSVQKPNSEKPVLTCMDKSIQRSNFEIWKINNTQIKECVNGEIRFGQILDCQNQSIVISNYYTDNTSDRTGPMKPFYISTDGGLKYTWIINDKKYTTGSGGPTGVYADCDNGNAAIYGHITLGDESFTKYYFDGHAISQIRCSKNFKQIISLDMKKAWNEPAWKWEQAKNIENETEICNSIERTYKYLEKELKQ